MNTLLSFHKDSTCCTILECLQEVVENCIAIKLFQKALSLRLYSFLYLETRVSRTPDTFVLMLSLSIPVSIPKAQV